MVTCAVYLHPCGPFASWTSSDMLFGAICSGLGTLGTDLTAMFQTGPGFAVSSAFPVRFGDRPQRFYPKPLTFDVSLRAVLSSANGKTLASRIGPKKFAREVSAMIKRLKQVGFLSEELFKQVANGSTAPLDVIFDDLTDGKRFTWIGDLLMLSMESSGWPLNQNGEPASLFMEVETLHNQIDRVAGATVEGLLFYEPQIRFHPQAGLWALVRTQDEDTLHSRVMPALRYLADSGLGANRTWGYGCFKLDGPEILEELPGSGTQANGWMSLSRYLPKEGEWREGEPIAYRLASLWPKREHKFPPDTPVETSAPIYKRRLRVFEPGSVFPLDPAQPINIDWYGDLAELVRVGEGPNQVFQSGLAIPIGLKVDQE